jgi:hypothetical protein
VGARGGFEEQPLSLRQRSQVQALLPGRGEARGAGGEAASRIATAKLGLHRVLAVEPGHWIVLEDIVRGTRARVRSANVSRDAVRWDILLGRVMDGEPQSLWGPVRFFEPRDEEELLAELRARRPDAS